jgi:hypothetical protein
MDGGEAVSTELTTGAQWARKMLPATPIPIRFLTSAWTSSRSTL